MRTVAGLGLALFCGLTHATDLAPVAGAAVAPAATAPPTAALPALERRVINSSCISSVLRELEPPISRRGSDILSCGDFLSWAVEAHGSLTEDRQQATSSPSCTVTTPASVSSDYSSYIDVIETYFSTVSSKASGIRTNCGADKLFLSFDQLCTPSLTMLFTSGANQTSVTSLKPPEPPGERIYIGDWSTAGEATGTGSATSSRPTPGVGTKGCPNIVVIFAMALVLSWGLG